MAISLGASLALHSRQPLDDRTLFNNLDELKSYPDNFLPTLFIAQVVEEPNTIFVYNKNNDLDSELAHWRRFKSGEKINDASYLDKGIIQILKDNGLIINNGILSLDKNVIPIADKKIDDDGNIIITTTIGGMNIITKKNKDGNVKYTEIGTDETGNNGFIVSGEKTTISEKESIDDTTGEKIKETIKQTVSLAGLKEISKIEKTDINGNITTSTIEKTKDTQNNDMSNGNVHIESTTITPDGVKTENIDDLKDGESIWMEEPDLDKIMVELNGLW